MNGVASIEEAVPRAFISHASEDKDRFVLQFATKLRSAGVDAWVDQWEMQAGDSLVQRIFDRGIAGADAFVVVLSRVSVTKRWVREELDAGVVQRINSDGKVRLIPIVLDHGVDVPTSIRHLLWLSVPELGVDGVVDAVVRALYRGSWKPPLGAAPAYTRLRQPGRLPDPVDDLVFGLIVEEWRRHGLTTNLFSDDVRAAAEKLGVGSEAFSESMHALLREGLIEARPILGGDRWWLLSIPDHVWLQVEEDHGVDLDAVRRRILSLVVNDGITRLVPADLGLHPFTVRAVLRGFERDGLLVTHQIVDGTFSVGNVNPLARRVLRD
jgi:hypothetical protein